MIGLYCLFKGAFQICLCKGTSVQPRQLSKLTHLSGCPNSYIVIHHLPPKQQMTRKFMREKWSHLTAAHGQHATVTENISNVFSPSPFLQLTGGEIHKETKELAPMQSVAKDCSFQQNWRFRPYLQASSSVFCNSLEKRRGFACFNCNSHLIGRWLKIFVAQDSSHGMEGVTSFFSARLFLMHCEVVCLCASLTPLMQQVHSFCRAPAVLFRKLMLPKVAELLWFSAVSQLRALRVRAMARSVYL